MWFLLIWKYYLYCSWNLIIWLAIFSLTISSIYIEICLVIIIFKEGIYTSEQFDSLFTKINLKKKICFYSWSIFLFRHFFDFNLYLPGQHVKMVRHLRWQTTITSPALHQFYQIATTTLRIFITYWIWHFATWSSFFLA